MGRLGFRASTRPCAHFRYDAHNFGYSALGGFPARAKTVTVTDEDILSSEKHIGRRAFLGLLGAGLVALFFGPGLLSRLSGGGPEAGGFAINSVAPAPAFDPTTWRLKVDGLVQKPLDLSFDEFSALPQVDRTKDFYCVEGWGVPNVLWTGVTVEEMVRRAGIGPTATHLVFHSGDGAYTDSLTIAEASDTDFILAHLQDGQPLGVDHGRPVRLVVPGRYGYKSVKWVIRVEAIAAGSEGYQGYWEQRGYSEDAIIS